MKFKNPEEQFKIIAIRPHFDCGKKYSKVLKNGRLYKFYKEYSFPGFPGIEESGDNISHYERESKVPSDLYSIENLQINISAIVGKNGSGKSTLLELIIYCIYILGTSLENDKDGNALLQPYYIQLERLIAKKEKDLSFLEDEKKRFLKTVSKSRNHTNEPSIEQGLEKLLELNIQQGDLEKEVKELRTLRTESVEEHRQIASNFHCSIYFELDKTVWEFNTKKFHKDKSDSPEEPSSYGIIKPLNPYSSNSQEIISSFFYSIILNYSHHALNSKFLGHWINTFFHKNDGYKTPGVINPMRTDGNFEINKEIYLSKHRLLANALIETLENRTKVAITEKQYIHKVRFTFTPSDDDNNIELGTPGSSDKRDDFIIRGDMNSVNLIMDLMPLYFENSFEEIAVQEKNLPYSIPLINYLTRKVYKIFRNYPEYNPQDKFNNIFDLFRTALPIIKKDKSHVSFKVDRAMFFLRKNLDRKSRSKWDMSKPSIEFTLPELLKWMEIESSDQIHLIFERIPPSLFDIDFILDDSNSKEDYEKLVEKELPTLTDLSSGEQQKIHIINAVVYHLNNIYSVHRSSKEVQRLKYNYVNIIFDEIELYFHPDLQRKFINDLLSAIKRLKHITKDSNRYIKALNILFSTHSPFILSDIPSQNILRLECGDNILETSSVPIDSQTFGANIHKLLGSSFFFQEKVFIGEFANNLIKNLIKTIQEYKMKPNTLKYKEYTEIEKQIAIIGEPFIRKKMQDMIREIYKKMIRIFHSNLEKIVEDYSREIENIFAVKRNNINTIVDFLSSPHPILESEVKGKVKPLLKALKVVLGKRKLEKVKNGETNNLIYYLNKDKTHSKSRSKAGNIQGLRHISGQLEPIFQKNKLHYLISGKARDLKRLNNEVSAMCTPDEPLYDYFFDYQDYYDILNDYIINKIKINCCPYCNRNYITSVTNVKGKRVIGPTYDHFFHKNKYKFLTLSFYNLIPSCYVCNSNLKGQTDFDLETNLYPYEDEFGDQVRFDFNLNLVKRGKNVEICFEPEIRIAPDASPAIKKKLNGYSTRSGEAKPGSLKVFQLEEIYKSHHDTVEEIHTKFAVNSPYYIDSIKGILDLLNVSEKEFYRYHFHNYYANEDFHRRPLAKLTRDIYDKMKLLQ